jgi:hypothetical protein
MGISHEMAQQNSLGCATKRLDLKVWTDGAAVAYVANRVYWAFLKIGYAMKLEPNRSPFQGVRSKKPYPGLKPWAMLSRRSAGAVATTIVTGGANREQPRTNYSTNHLSPFTSHLSPLTSGNVI